MVYNTPMKKFINKITIPLIILFVVNLVGFAFYKNYEGAVIGSVVGMIIALLALEIRANYE